MSEREKFEAWAISKGHDTLHAPDWKNVDYHSLPCEDAWRAWQASRRDALEEAAPDLGQRRRNAESRRPSDRTRYPRSRSKRHDERWR